MSKRPGACDACGEPPRDNKKLKSCSRCKQAFYHDAECQKNHYKTHKVACRQLAAASNAASFSNLSISFKHEWYSGAEYPQTVSNATAVIMDQTNEIGKIEAVIVHRQRVPPGHCYSVFDDYSSELQWVGCALMEPKYGRTNLQSLAPHDNHTLGFMYISEFHIDDEYKKDGSSNAAADALRKFLNHQVITSNVSSVAYVFDPTEGMTSEVKGSWEVHRMESRHAVFGDPLSPVLEAAQKDWDSKMDGFARLDANAFLRNGFFQDPAIALNSDRNDRILVACAKHFKQPLKSHTQATQIQLISSGGGKASDLQSQTDEDKELFDYLKKSCSSWECKTSNKSSMLREVSENVQKLLSKGATVSRSCGLHAAVANNAFEVVMFLLNTESTAVNARDNTNGTPLMLAAASAAGRTNKDGISDTRVLDHLIARGANKDLKDKNGMTAYGHFVHMSIEYGVMMNSLMGTGVTNQSHATWQASTPSGRAVQSKLLPTNGLSDGDKTGGKPPGLIDYSGEDGGFGADLYDY